MMYNLKNKIPPKNRDIVKLCYLKLIWIHIRTQDIWEFDM